MKQTQSLKCPRCDHYCSFDSLFCNRCGVTLQGLVKSLPESEVWEARVSLHVLWPIVGLYILYGLVLSGLVAMFTAQWTAIPILLLVTLLILPLGWIVFYGFQLKLTWRYRLTTRRLQVIRGWLTQTTKEVELEKIDDVIVRQTPYGVGRLMIISAAAGHLRLTGVRRPLWLKDMIQALVFGHRTI